VKILIVEDDERVARHLERALLLAGHRADIAGDGAVAVEQAAGESYDLILLDILLPSLDGFAVCRELRQQHNVRTPILMLTARDAVTDRVNGLDAGADDYLTKPFATEELLARIRAVARRGEGTDEVLRVADLALDPARHEVRRGDRPIELTPKEFDLLEYLMRRAGRVVTRDQILQNVWRELPDSSSKGVDLYVHYLRNKIDRDTARPLVRTVRGVGYLVDG
jgi:DNA-binding response OmpR family regulator